MSKNDLEHFIDEHDGVVSVSELANFLDLDEQDVRRWARDNDVRRIGPNFAFTAERAEELAAELLGDDEEDDEGEVREEGDDGDDSDDESEESDADDDADADEDEDDDDEK